MTAKYWTREEEAKLYELRQSGLPILSIIPLMKEAGFDRSYDSIENKLRQTQKTERRHEKASALPDPPAKEPEAKYSGFAIKNYQISRPITKTMWLFDSHYPHNIPITNLLHFANDFQPHIFGFGGDNWSLDVISHWQEDRFKNWGMDNVIASFNKEAAGFREHIRLFREAMPNTKFVYLLGNHELWLEHFANKFPQTQKPTIQSVLGDVAQGMDFVPHGGFYQIGKIHFCHGDQFGTENPPKQALMRTGKNIVFGHWHSHKQWPQFSMIDETDKHQAIQVPCYAKLAPDYLKGRPHDWSNGFFTACIKESGNFSPFVQPVSPEGRFLTQYGITYEA